MSSLIPFGRSLNVGGKSENIAKLMVVLVLVELGWISTTKVLLTSVADVVGLSFS